MSKWELVDEDGRTNTHKLKVEGGWLYRIKYFTGCGPKSISLCFVPEEAKTK